MSLQEQRDAIQRYAARNNLAIASWFEERETAAARGRPLFTEMLRGLTNGNASGVVIHKIDRSARNLRDWADLGELIDRGVQVHFANDNLDLHTRGGRLSADIQAVVASDFIRNLREETRKGFYGRLKQGLYPLPAPVGYLDCGKGKPKEPDPATAPLVRQAFELYATGRFTLDTLEDQLFRLGLRSRRGGRVTHTSLSTLLNNPFYIGLLRLRCTGETFPGAHEPLIPQSLFARVKDVLAGKVNPKVLQHDFLFRRLLRCARCGYSLIGERQKGHVYYRCHTRSCPMAGIREDMVETAIGNTLSRLTLSAAEKAYLGAKVDHLGKRSGQEREAQRAGNKLQLARLSERLRRLTDAYLDGVLEKDLFEDRKAALLLEQAGLREQQALLEGDSSPVPARFAEFLELVGSLSFLYKTGIPADKRELLQIVTSNRRVTGKNVALTLAPPFSLIEKRGPIPLGVPYRARPRTLDQLLRKVGRWFTENPTPAWSLHFLHGIKRRHASKDGDLAAWENIPSQSQPR